MAIPTHHYSATNKQDYQPALLAAINVMMGFDATKQHDPVKKAERDMISLNPNIDNNGGSLYNSEEFCIVTKFKSEDEIQRDENRRSGYGDITNAERIILQETSFYDFYEDYEDDWLEDDNHYGYPDEYMRMLETGEMEDDGMSCRLGSPSMWSSHSEDDEYEDDVDPADDLEAQSGEEYPDIEAAAEAEPEDEPAIESDVDLSSQFAKATSPDEEIEPEAATPEPAKITPVPTTANNASYQLSA